MNYLLWHFTHSNGSEPYGYWGGGLYGDGGYDYGGGYGYESYGFGWSTGDGRLGPEYHEIY